jgi:ubiquinone/menaquinone biosynthesis C-methylase UbiE
VRKHTAFTKEFVSKINKQVYDSTAHLYDEKHQHTVFSAENQKRVEEIIEYIIKDVDRNNECIKLLDAGCGTGNILSLSKNKVSLVAGTDISAECLKLSSRYTNNLARSDVSSLPFRSASVDVITAYSVLHHLFDYTEFLREAYRVLGKGGWLYTDFDHNNLMLRKMLPLFRGKIFSIPLFNFLKKAIKKNRINDSEATDYKLANFHNELKGGINFLEVRKKLKKIGFRQIDILAYEKQGSIYCGGKGIFSMLRYPLVYCIAKK